MTFDIDDFLHIREKYDDDWWIGRVVSPDHNLGFIPSPVKIEKIRSNRKPRKNGARFEESSIGQKERKKGEKTRTPYEVVPNVRPVILVGPSLKGYEGKFRDWSKTVQITDNFSDGHDAKSSLRFYPASFRWPSKYNPDTS